MAYEKEAVYLPRANERLIITATAPLDKPTSVWWTFALSADGIWIPKGAKQELRLQGEIAAAKIADGLDSRISNQKESIDRLLDHLKHHCPQLIDGKTKCPHMSGQE